MAETAADIVARLAVENGVEVDASNRAYLLAKGSSRLAGIEGDETLDLLAELSRRELVDRRQAVDLIVRHAKEAGGDADAMQKRHQGSQHDILSADSRGEISAMAEIDRLGLDSVRDLRIAVCRAGLEPPKPPPDEVRKQVDAALPLLRAALIPEEEYLRRLREEVQVGVDDVRAGRFVTRSVDEIAADVERENGIDNKGEA